MESFGNYTREEPFDPFSVMLFKALQVVAFLFFLALLAMNPEAKTGKVDVKAEVIITVGWPDNHPDDIDTYVEDPAGNLVWFHSREAGLLHLDRDDRGLYRDTIEVNGKQIANPLNQETVTLRGIVPGEYVVNVYHYVATGTEPVPVTVKVEKVNPILTVVFYDTLKVDHKGQELTAVRFTMNDKGDIVSTNNEFKSLIRAVRKPTSGNVRG